MKNIILFIAFSIVLSCGKDKVVLLPEISHSDISEIKDVSAAYIFYDETKPDSTELNRRNLISTTNWLINVDKRLTLKQVIPHIKFLQEKKGNSSHKNENAKNYFTCNDTSRKSLGFIEFTDVVYQNSEFKPKQNYYDQGVCINVVSSDTLYISFSTDEGTTSNKFHIRDLSEGVKLDLINEGSINTNLFFNKNISFQNYISIKSQLSKLDIENITISKDEFIY